VPILPLSFGLLLSAGLLGGVLAAMHLRPGNKPATDWRLGVLHGVLGTIGFAGLLLALRGPTRGEAMGVAGFGQIAAILLGIALLAGVAVLVLRMRRRPIPGLVIGTHATIAVSGIVILAAYALVG
jgi:hypothetical protein